MVEAYLSATFDQTISDFFDLCLHWKLVVRNSLEFFFLESIPQNRHGTSLLVFFSNKGPEQDAMEIFMEGFSKKIYGIDVRHWVL